MRIRAVVALLGLVMVGVLSGCDPAPGFSPLPVPAPAPTPPPASVPTGRFAVALSDVDGRPVRWNPCQPLRIVLALPGAPSFARAELAAAVTAIESASGLDLVVTGTTTERPVPNRPLRDTNRYGSAYAPVLVSFATAAELPFGSPTASGWGQAVPVADGTGHRQYVTGQVVLRPDHGWTQGTGSANPLSLMLRHELGHVLGLGHVPVTTEIMGTGGSGSVRSWGPGDLRGLRALGRPAGCLPTLT